MIAIVGGIMAMGLLVALPRPVVSQRTPATQAVVTDSGAITVMELNRSGRWADAERVGLSFLSGRSPLAMDGEECAVLIGVTYAQSLQGERAKATASMARFDASCKTAVFPGFLPGEEHRVRRLVNGEALGSVYTSARAAHTPTTGGATDVMMLNREGRRAEAEQAGLKFLARPEHRAGDPEGCAVLIGVVFAQAVQQRSAEATASLARFDRECSGVAYLDWFPAESDRVRGVVHGTPLRDVYQVVRDSTSR